MKKNRIIMSLFILLLLITCALQDNSKVIVANEDLPPYTGKTSIRT